MRTRWRKLVPGTLGAALLAAGQLALASPPPVADRVLLNGRVYTGDEHRSIADGVAIYDGRILALGDESLLRPFIGPATEVQDLAGRMVLPGLHDMHIHLLGVVPPPVCDLANQPLDLDALSARVAECLREYPVAPGEWLMVLEWNASRQRAGRRFATLREALDAVSTEHPIYLHASGGHHGAVNSPALARARTASGEVVGFSARTLGVHFPELRPLVAVDQDGEPTGKLSEHARAPIGRPRLYGGVLSMDAVSSMLPDVVTALAAAGITSAMEARTSPELLATLSGFASAGGLRIRVHTALFIDPNSGDEDPVAGLAGIVAELSRLRSRHGSRMLKADAVKIFADGVLDGSPASDPPLPPNAAVLLPYLPAEFAAASEEGELQLVGYREDAAPQGSGVLRNEPELLREYVRLAADAGFHVHVHAIGDRAVRESVDAFAAARPQARGGVPFSLAHVQLAHPQDQRRIGELGIAVVFTFAWIPPDPARDLAVIPFIDRVEPARGLYHPEHYYYRNAYPAESIRRHGGLLVGGSDAPVGNRHPRPFVNIAAAVSRSGPEGILNAYERIDIHEAIAAYTINGARMTGQEDELGSIEAGKLADLVVIDRDIVGLAEAGAFQALAETRVEMTLVGGEVIFDARASVSADANE